MRPVCLLLDLVVVISVTYKSNLGQVCNLPPTGRMPLRVSRPNVTAAAPRARAVAFFMSSPLVFAICLAGRVEASHMETHGHETRHRNASAEPHRRDRRRDGDDDPATSPRRGDLSREPARRPRPGAGWRKRRTGAHAATTHSRNSRRISRSWRRHHREQHLQRPGDIPRGLRARGARAGGQLAAVRVAREAADAFSARTPTSRASSRARSAPRP
jgi:hypothetical protein